MVSWNRNTLLHYAQTTQSESDLRKLDRAINSITETQLLCGYHYNSLRELLEEHMRNHPTEASLFMSRFSIDPEVNNRDFEFNLSCRANIIAIVRTLHSLSDIVGCVIYFGLGLNLNDNTKLVETKVSMYNVKEKLKTLPKYTELLSLLNDLTNNPDFKHISRLSNQTKHSAIVKANSHFNLKLKGIERYQFMFEEIETKPGRMQFQETSAIPLIEKEFKRQNDGVINILHCLDALVSELVKVPPKANT